MRHRLADRPDDKLSIIFDYTGFSVNMIDWTLTKEAIFVLQNYYPEQYADCDEL
jgi:hypothetical protein